MQIIAQEDDDALNETTTLIHTASSTDIEYDTLTEEVVVSVVDNESAEIQIIEASDTLNVDEGERAMYQMRLGSAPSSSVTITVFEQSQRIIIDTNSATDGDQNTLIFTNINWSTPQNVTVTYQHDDDVISDTLKIQHVLTSMDLSYDALSEELFVVVHDDDKPGIITSLFSDTLTINEGEIHPFMMKLSSIPQSKVEVMIEPVGDLIPNPERISFSSQNWNEHQEIILGAGNDLDAVNDTLTMIMVGSGSEYDDIVHAVSIVIIDDEVNHIFVIPANIRVIEGASAQMKIRLTSEPIDDVIVVANRQGDLTVSPSNLIFTDHNWDKTQLVTLIASEDDDQENDRERLMFSASGGNYDDVTQEFTVTIQDTDVAGIAVFPSSLTIAEESSLHMDVRLNTEPDGNVIVSIPQVGDIESHLKTLTFTEFNWNITQQIILRVTDDADQDNDREVLTLIASGANYAGLTQEILVNIVDNDLSKIDIKPDPIPTEEEEPTGTIDEGETVEFDVVLGERPNGDVMVEISSSHPSLMVTPNLLKFTYSNWNVEQTVMMTSSQDDNDENDYVAVTLMTSGGGYGRLSQQRRFAVRDKTAVSIQHSEVEPVSVILWGNYPNPFSIATNVMFALPEPANISMIVTDLLGRTVIRIPDQWYGVGIQHSLQIPSGELPSGIYYYRLKVNIDGQTTEHTKSMMIIR